MVGRLADRVEGAILVDQMAATVTVVNLETQEKRESCGLVRRSERASAFADEYSTLMPARGMLKKTFLVTVIRDLLGKDVVRQGDQVNLQGDFPVKGDMIATGFTVLPWREKVLL